MGAWIEIANAVKALAGKDVAPLVGAWIEILVILLNNGMYQSLLSWERGLKYSIDNVIITYFLSRSSRGSVD